MTSGTERTYDLDGIRRGLETDGIIACRVGFDTPFPGAKVQPIVQKHDIEGLVMG